MKKLFPILLVLVLLVGCSDATAKVSGSSTALITMDGAKVTKGQIYSIMANQDPTATVLQMATKIVLNKEIGLTDEVKKLADTQLATIKTSLGDSLQTYLDYYGYADVQALYDENIVPGIQQELLVKKHVTENFDAFAVTYYPRKARVIETATEALATAAIAEIKAGADFGAVAKKYSSTAYTGAEQIVFSATSLAADVLTFVKSTTVPTLSPTAIADATTGKFYVVQVTVADPAKFKDEIIANFATQDTFVSLTLATYFKSGKFKIYDKSIYDLFAANYSSYMIQVK